MPPDNPMNIMSGTGISFNYGESSASEDDLTSRVELVEAPSSQSDMSVLPGAVAPAANTAYEAYGPGVHWTIRGGETVWSQSVRATV